MAYEIYKPVKWDTVSATLEACPLETKATALQYLGSCATTYGADTEGMDMYLPQILQELKHPAAGKEVKLGVLSMLAALGPQAIASCYSTHLESLLADAHKEVRYELCLTLVTAGMLLEGAAPAMARLLSDQSDMVRYGACAALGSMKQQSYAGEVTKLLDDASPEVQGMACVALAQMGSAGEQSGAIATKLTVVRSRMLCLKAIALMGTSGVEHFDAVVDCLTDTREDVREAAVAAVKGLSVAKSPGDESRGKVASLLQHHDGGVRVVACRAIRSLGSVAVLENLSRLQELLDDEFSIPVCTPLSLGGARGPAAPESRKVRCAAAMALAILGEDAPQGVSECIRKLFLLQDPETTACALDALATLGKAAQAEVGYIMDILRDDSAMVRAKAVAALAAAGGLAGASEIVDLLKDPVPLVREASIRALASMEGDVSYVSKLYARVQDSSTSVCVAAIEALAKTANGRHYASLLAQRLQGRGEAPEVLVATVAALAQMGERGAACAEDVAACLDSFFAIVRAAAAKSLGQMASDEARVFVGRLRDLQLDQDETVRVAAQDAVQRLMASEPQYLTYGVAEGE